MADQNIGAARVHLVVDATDWESTLAQARNAAAQFGTDAERAFEKSEGGVRRAATRLLDYAASLGRVDTQMERYIRNASRAGVEEPIIRAAIARWEEYQKEIMSTTAALEEAARIDKAFDQARAESAQRAITTQVAPGLDRDASDQARRRADAEAALVPVLQQQEAAYEQMVRSQYDQLNALLGVADAGRDTSDQAHRRADAEAALLPLLQDQERQYSDMLNLAHRINDARDEARRGAAQQDINSTLGVDDTSAEQRIRRQADARAALTDIVEKEIAAEQKLQATRQQGEQFLSYLKNLGDTAGKTHWEILELKAAQLGISAEAAPMIAGLRDQAAAMGAGTLSAKQYEWAMRGLPAQLTDISVGLATGQKPWMVMLQQGGQLKDMFGGIAPAAKAVGGAVWAMVNPLTIAATAIGAAAFSAWQAEQRLSDFAVAVAKGGIAETARDLQAVADAIDNIAYVSRGQADEAVSKIAASGKLAGENLTIASAATARWAAVTGEGADAISAKFIGIAEGPLEAIESGQVRVTVAQYEYIKSLVATGDQQKAVNELTAIFATNTNRDLDEVTRNLGAMSREWMNVKDVTGSALNAVTEFGNKAVESVTDVRDKLFETINAYRELGGVSGVIGRGAVSVPMQAVLGPVGYRLQQQLAERARKAAAEAPPITVQWAGIESETYDADQAKRDKQRKDAIDQFLATQDEAAQRQLTLNKLQEEGNRLGQAQTVINAVKARQQKQWDEQDARRARGSREGRDGTAAIRDAAQAEIAAITTQTRLLQQQYDQRAITVEDYYGKLETFADEELAVTLRSIEAQKAAVAGRKDASQRIEQLESQAARAREQHTQREIELDEQRRRAVQQRKEAYQQYVWTLQDGTVQQERQLAAEEASISMGGRQVARMQAVNALHQEQHDKLVQLIRDNEQQKISDAELYERKQALLEETAKRLDNLRQSWDRQDQAEKSWLTGSARAWQDWQTNVGDVAQKGYEMTTTAISGFADATAQALNGNLDSFKSFFEQLHMMILKFVVEQRLTAWLQSISGAGSSSGKTDWLGLAVSAIGSIWGANAGAGASAAATSNMQTANANLSSQWFSSRGFADGGVPGGTGLAAYRNQLVSRPTIFPFARGGVPNVGLMGEAGTEAIMPLTRIGGQLGVRAVESRRGTTSIEQTFVVQGKMDRTTADQLARKTGRATARAMNRG